MPHKSKEAAAAYFREYQKRYYARTAENKRSSFLKRRYGITLTDYERMAAEQHNQCAICGIEAWALRTGRLHVDHDHATGKARGLLCPKCNVALGVLEQVELVEKAFSYLKKYTR